MARVKGQPALSRERILRVALKLIEQEDLDALSMRRLAQELDVWPMSVYRYFKDKDELLDAIAASAADVVELPSRRGPWRGQLRQLLEEARNLMGSDPNGLGRRWPRAFLAPGPARLWESGISILEGAGLPAEEAVSAWRAVWSYTFGFAMFQAAGSPGEAARRARAAIAALPEDDYPTLVGRGDVLAAALARDDEFGYGLERLLDGIEARVGGGIS